jgi:hypothetical protein
LRVRFFCWAAGGHANTKTKTVQPYTAQFYIDRKLWTATDLVTAKGRRIANDFTAYPHLLPMFHATLAAAAVLQCSSKMVGVNTAHYVIPNLLYAGA